MESPFVKVSILGNMPGGEVWSVNPCFRLNPPQELTHLELIAAVAAVNAVTVPAGLRSLLTSSTNVSGCRIEARQIDGTLNDLAEGSRGAVVTGTGGSAQPYQSAVVVSLLSTHPGGSGRGRLYWPATGVGLDIYTLRLDSATTAGVLGAMKTYLSAIQAALEATFGIDVDLCVWSRTVPSTYAISTLRVGDVIDTQRRRRDQLVETRVQADYP